MRVPGTVYLTPTTNPHFSEQLSKLSPEFQVNCHRNSYVVLLAWVPEYRSVAALGCVAVIFALRAAAIHWDLAVPHWLMTKPKSG